MHNSYDVCVVGSGAGGGPLAWSLARRGLSVALLDRGEDYPLDGVRKDEVLFCRESPFIPQSLSGVREVFYGNDAPVIDRQLWGATVVGGRTKIMSGFFFRMPEDDFFPQKKFGTPHGATHTDWVIDRATLDPYYDLVEREVGISPSSICGLPPLDDHPAAKFIDHHCNRLGISTEITPRAVL